MKRLISVALALVMVLCVFTACGTPVCPVGTYKDSTETSIIEMGAYDEKTETGTMKITNTINLDLVLEGTYTLTENEAKVSSFVTFTASNGEVTEYLYDVTMDVMQSRGDSPINYFGPNYVEAGTPAAE